MSKVRKHAKSVDMGLRQAWSLTLNVRSHHWMKVRMSAGKLTKTK